MNNQIIKLINWFLLTPDEAKYILNKIHNKFETRNEFIQFVKKLEFEIKDENIFLYYITRKIFSSGDSFLNLVAYNESKEENISSFDSTSFDDFNTEDEIDTIDLDYKNDRTLNKIEKLSIEKFNDYFSIKTENEIVDELVKYVMSNNPEILNGFDRSVFKIAKENYKYMFGHVRRMYINFGIIRKLTNAQNKAESIIKENIQKHQEISLQKWAVEFTEFSEKVGIKQNKSNIKDFLKSKNIKGNPMLVDIIYSLIKEK
ncbi:MAG: hypothetical protein ACOYMA_16625 [Bacteroidia bacterium]